MEENQLVYELNQDLVLEDVRPLKTISLLDLVQRLYRPELILEHVMPLYPEITFLDHEKMRKSKRSWEYIEETIVRQIKTLIPVSMENEIIDRATHLVGSQIYIFLSKNYYAIDALHAILRNLKFTTQGTVNTKETFHKVIQLSDLDISMKFEIACRNFMGESFILGYFNDLPQYLIQHYLNEASKREELIPLAFFLCRFSGETKKIDRNFFRNEDADPVFIYFSNVNHISAIQYLFYWAELSFNDMAVHYLWNEYISRMDRRVLIINFLMSNVHGDIRLSNIIFFLLSNIYDHEKILLFNSCGSVFIKYLLQQARWHCYFNKVIDMLKSHFDDESYVIILRFMIYTLCEKELSADKFSNNVFKEFIKMIPQRVKINIILKREGFMSNMLRALYLQRDVEAFIIFLEIDDLLGADRILRTDVGIELFDMLVCNDDFDFINGVLGNISCSADNIREFGNRLLNRKGYEICDFLISNKKFESLQNFLMWCQTFASPESISGNLDMKNGKFIKNILFQSSEYPDKLRLKLAEKILRFCFKTRKERNYYKTRLILTNESSIEDLINPHTYSISLYTDVRNCAINSKFSFLSQLFRWKNCDYGEMNLIKCSLLTDDEFFRVVFRERNLLDYIPKYLNWYNCRFNDKNYFNRSFLKQDRLFVEKIENQEFKFVRDLVELLQPESVDVQNFKNKLYSLTEQFFQSILSPTLELRDFLEWLTSAV